MIDIIFYSSIIVIAILLVFGYDDEVIDDIINDVDKFLDFIGFP